MVYSIIRREGHGKVTVQPSAELLLNPAHLKSTLRFGPFLTSAAGT